MFNPENSPPERSSETPKPDKDRLRQLLEDPELLPKMKVLEMDLRESNTVSLEKSLHESLDKGNFLQFLDMCQSLAERLGEEEKPVVENFLMALAAGEAGSERLQEGDIEELVRRISKGDFK